MEVLIKKFPKMNKITMLKCMLLSKGYFQIIFQEAVAMITKFKPDMDNKLLWRWSIKYVLTIVTCHEYVFKVIQMCSGSRFPDMLTYIVHIQWLHYKFVASKFVIHRRFKQSSIICYLIELIFCLGEHA